MNESQKGQHYRKLKPVFSIWIMDTPVFPDTEAYHLTFRPYDAHDKIELSDQMTIHILQLPMFNETDRITSEKDRWLYFFKQAQNHDDEQLPETLQTKEMIQAMKTLKDFSKDEKRFLLYQSRLDEEFTLNTWKSMLKDAKRDLKKAQREKEKERREKEKAQQGKEKYLKILKEKGIDIDSV
ncbi:MAG: PD-(D/E)XK nuclease family transposase [Desulfamplus sp.]|nr:PD-(D/E)XK nuclease family transposase [Desulfamplus sp.]